MKFQKFTTSRLTKVGKLSKPFYLPSITKEGNVPSVGSLHLFVF